MKRFLTRVLIFVILVGVSFMGVLLQVDGYDDDFYFRFTSSQQEALILGTSRAAQGLVPEVFSNAFERPVFNFAFTRSFSPYNQQYAKSIRDKIAPNTSNGLFILAVDCWSLMGSERQVITGKESNKGYDLLGSVNDVNLNPNIPYLINRFAGRYFEIFEQDTSTFLHKDGWLEVNVPMDSTSVSGRTRSKLEAYRNLSERLRLSSNYIDVLNKLVEQLKLQGEVYLVRLPVDPRMREIETAYEKQFNTAIASAIMVSDGYLDLKAQDEKMRYTDGNHLHSSSARAVSQLVSDWIIETRMTQLSIK